MIRQTLMVLGVSITLVSTSTAQDMAMTSVELPDICKTGMQHGMGTMMMDMMNGMDQAHQDMAMGMDETNAQMMQGMMAEDIDVAFVCAMIPHHQAAINMAKAEVRHGDSDWAKEMAQKVIDTQQQEIDEMLNWLKEQK